MTTHGTVSGYTHLRCRCDLCRHAKSRDQKIRRLADLRGQQYRRPAWPLQRRVRGLARLGWDPDALEVETSVSYRVIDDIRSGRGTQVYVATDEALRKAYPRLADTFGPSKRTAKFAERQGWPLPNAWTRYTIDDPHAGPLHLGSGHIHVDDIEDALTWGYTTAQQVADRLGVSRDAVQQACKRVGRDDLLEKLRRGVAA